MSERINLTVPDSRYEWLCDEYGGEDKSDSEMVNDALRDLQLLKQRDERVDDMLAALEDDREILKTALNIIQNNNE